MPAHHHAAPHSGLSATGATLLAVLLTCSGALLDVIVARGLSWGFTIGFLLSCIWVAARVEHRHLLTAVIVPPLMFVLGVLLAQQVLGVTGPGSWLVREVADMGTVLALKAPQLLGGEALAAVIALFRVVQRRSARSRATSSRSPVPLNKPGTTGTSATSEKEPWAL